MVLFAISRWNTISFIIRFPQASFLICKAHLYRMYSRIKIFINQWRLSTALIFRSNSLSLNNFKYGYSRTKWTNISYNTDNTDFIYLIKPVQWNTHVNWHLLLKILNNWYFLCTANIIFISFYLIDATSVCWIM